MIWIYPIHAKKTNNNVFNDSMRASSVCLLYKVILQNIFIERTNSTVSGIAIVYDGIPKRSGPQGRLLKNGIYGGSNR